MLAWLLGELDSTESERPLVSGGEASSDVLAEKTGPSSKLVTGRMEAILRGLSLEPFGVDVEGRPFGLLLLGEELLASSNFASRSFMLSGPAFLAFVVAGDAALRLGLGDLAVTESMDARDAVESAVPGRLDDSFLFVSLLDLGENMSLRMMGELWDCLLRAIGMADTQARTHQRLTSKQIQGGSAEPKPKGGRVVNDTDPSGPSAVSTA